MEYTIEPQPIPLIDGGYELVTPLKISYRVQTIGNTPHFQLRDPVDKSYGSFSSDLTSAGKEMLSSLAEELHHILDLEKEHKALSPLEQEIKRELSKFIQPMKR